MADIGEVKSGLMGVSFDCAHEAGIMAAAEQDLATSVGRVQTLMRGTSQEQELTAVVGRLEKIRADLADAVQGLLDTANDLEGIASRM